MRIPALELKVETRALSVLMNYQLVSWILCSIARGGSYGGSSITDVLLVLRSQGNFTGQDNAVKKSRQIIGQSCNDGRNKRGSSGGSGEVRVEVRNLLGGTLERRNSSIGAAGGVRGNRGGNRRSGKESRDEGELKLHGEDLNETWKKGRES